MLFHTTETVCAITGTHPANLKRWVKQGLLTPRQHAEHWSDAQLSEIRTLVDLTATGATPASWVRSFGGC